MAREKLGNRVYGTLLERIASGEYSLGGRLPSEPALARQIGVSRPVLRQALAQLKADGLVRSRRGAGNFVARREAASAVDFGPLQSIPDVQRCLGFRAALESAAAHDAALLQDDARLRAVEEAMLAMEKAIAEGAPSVELDFEFHLAIAAATRNRFFLGTLQALRASVLFGINLTRSLSTRPANLRLEEVLREHRNIYEAIRAARPEAAAQAMSLHLQAGIKRLFNA